MSGNSDTVHPTINLTLKDETALVITKRGAGYTPYLLGEEDANKIADKSNC